jgi:hypothetical protein
LIVLPQCGDKKSISYQHRDADDPLAAPEYVEEMYEHFRSKEKYDSVRNVYMENQRFISVRMRSVLMDWLVEVTLKFKLVPETLYLTVNLIDRYLAQVEVTRPQLQLVGVTALLIASKYEELYAVELADLVYICDRTYTEDEVSLFYRITFCVISIGKLQPSNDVSSYFRSLKWRKRYSINLITKLQSQALWPFS